MSDGIWVNDDGLTVKFGVEEGKTKTIGEERIGGPFRIIEAIVDAADLPKASEGAVPLSDTLKLGEGWVVQSAEVFIEEDITGGPVDIGMVEDDRTTAVDTAGFVSGLTGTAGSEVTGSLGPF